MYSRREFNQTLAALLPLPFFLPVIDSAVGSVRLGTITYSFRDVPYVAGQFLVDSIIQDCNAAGVGLIELMCNHVEPVTEYMAKEVAAGTPAGNALKRGVFAKTPEGAKARDDLREWRLSTPISYFTSIREQFRKAGISIYAYTVNGMGDDFTSEELNRMFAQAKALGAATIASSATVSVAQKLVPFVEKHRYPVAFHNHADLVDPNQFCMPESFQKAMAMSKYFRINPDIAHYVQANLDPVPFLEENHERITHLHVADGRKNNAPEVPFGTGDTPLKQVMTLLKDKRYSIPAIVELEYAVPPGSSSPAEVKKCTEYLQQYLV